MPHTQKATMGLLQQCARVGLEDIHQKDLSECLIYKESWLPSGKVKPILSPALPTASSNKMLQSPSIMMELLFCKQSKLKPTLFFLIRGKSLAPILWFFLTWPWAFLWWFCAFLGQFRRLSASIKPWSHLLSEEMVSRSQGWKFNYGGSILSGTFKDAES